MILKKNLDLFFLMPTNLSIQLAPNSNGKCLFYTLETDLFYLGVVYTHVLTKNYFVNILVVKFQSFVILEPIQLKNGAFSVLSSRE